MATQTFKHLNLAGVTIAAAIIDGKLVVEIDTYQGGAPDIHDADGVPRVQIAVNDSRVWPAVECSCGMARPSDLHSGDCAVVR